MTWRIINSYGIKLGHRTYDGQALNPYRRQHSGVTAKKGLWEVHHDPYDVTRIWVRNHHDGGWITAAVDALERPARHRSVSWPGSTPASIWPAGAATRRPSRKSPTPPAPCWTGPGTARRREQTAASDDRVRSPDPGYAKRPTRPWPRQPAHRLTAILRSARREDADLAEVIPLGSSTPARRQSNGGDDDARRGQAGERRDPTTTLTGWRRFVDADPAAFDLPDEPHGPAWPTPTRPSMTRPGCRYHSELVVVSTSAVRQVATRAGCWPC